MINEQDHICVCGRSSIKVHCPHCGSYVVYGYSARRRHDTVTRADGTIAQLRSYRCERCTSMFNEDDWKLHCFAPSPRVGRPLAAKRQVSEGDKPVHFDSLDEAPTLYAEAAKKYLKRQADKEKTK